MMESVRRLQNLRARVADGDAGAARELRGRLEPAIASMVRRALHFPAERSLVHAAVQAEVQHLGLTASGELLAEDPKVVGVIAGRICGSVIEQFRYVSTPLRAGETVDDLVRLSF